jgi:hypothetical protein
MNPQQAEQDFDKSITTKKLRQTTDLGNSQSIKINPRISLNHSTSLFKQQAPTNNNPVRVNNGLKKMSTGRNIEESKGPARNLPPSSTPTLSKQQ